MKTLRELYQEHEGKVSDKWDIYLSEYDRFFSPYREKKIRLLEVGVQNGGSLEIWNKYFPNADLLVGCDINEDCKLLEYNSEKIKIVVGDANLNKTEKDIRDISSYFDIIIDDGSHTSADIVLTFSKYFPYLKDGGVFVAEDLHCSYWKNYGGGLYDLTSSISFFKQLVDIINYEHWGLNKGISEAISVFNAKYGLSLNLNDLEKIHSIEFVNSLCIVHKKTASNNRLGRRNIVGHDELVMPVLESLNGSFGQPFLQDEEDEDSIHPLLRIEQRDEEINEIRRKELLLEDEISKLGQQINSRESEIEKLESEIEKYKQQQVTIGSGLVDCKKNNEQLEKDIFNLISSKSWKVTRPLRLVASAGKKCHNLITFTLTALKKTGGFRSAFRKATKLYRNEGIKGLSRGYHFVVNGSHESVTVNHHNYEKWILSYDVLSEEEKYRIQSDIKSFKCTPLVSIVMPVYNPNITWLDEAIKSVQAQLYENWELCIADDNSKNNNIKKFLEKQQSTDARIKVVYRDKNGHISAASNSALEIASGEWVALMDQDDLLPEHALYCVAKAINENPEAGLIYSDEDKVDEAGNRHSPYFKSDWNRSLFYSQNMICHLGAYRKSLIDKVGGFQEGLEGAQDHDLALKVIELLKDEAIVHIPKILYHWRVHSQSTAGGADAKPYAAIAGEKAIKGHMERSGIKADVTSNQYGYRVKYSLPDILPKVSLIIPTRNGHDLVKICIESIISKTTYANYEIILIDNGSDDPESLEYFSKLETNYDNITIKRDERPFNYSALNNDAVKVAKGDIIGLVNNDIEVIEPEWLSEMVSQVIQQGVGAVGAKLLYPTGLVQHPGVVIGIGGVAGHVFHNIHPNDPGYFGRLNLVNEYSAVTAACLLVKKEDYEEVGGLNEDDLKIAFNDVDLCLKLKELGLRNIYTPYALLYHHESASRGYEDNPEKIARFNSEIRYMEARWEKYIEHDPCYNPNLTLKHSDFSLAWPPRGVY
ncbi:glycosyltransferase [Vreelandella neptunia]|uniref:Glycosyltransferase n=1 Tax=Vreelandella neptunia TaxID=115551 RepID=A0ABS9S1H8_9GAMM|nr:glycosyltransferase [Halomonas neptunia]MCH4809913.1 glycosyltransferase [Halomonas neptunia]